MFHVVKQALDDVVRSGRGPTEIETEMCDLVQTIFVADLIFQDVLFNANNIVQMAEVGYEIANRAVKEHCIRELEGA